MTHYYPLKPIVTTDFLGEVVISCYEHYYPLKPIVTTDSKFAAAYNQHAESIFLTSGCMSPEEFASSIKRGSKFDLVILINGAGEQYLELFRNPNMPMDMPVPQKSFPATLLGRFLRWLDGDSGLPAVKRVSLNAALTLAASVALIHETIQASNGGTRGLGITTASG
jgi:hypothetical protein